MIVSDTHENTWVTAIISPAFKINPLKNSHLLLSGYACETIFVPLILNFNVVAEVVSIEDTTKAYHTGSLTIHGHRSSPDGPSAHAGNYGLFYARPT